MIYISLFLDGDDCQFVICQNGATCIDDVHDYTCECLNGFTGSHCEFSKYWFYSIHFTPVKF